MRGYAFLLTTLLVAMIALPAPASGIFNRRSKTNPTERVPALILTVKTDRDERKRASAAEELREYDPNGFPEIVPILVDVLQHDAKPSVRAEAAQSLSKLRPVSRPAGEALEQAAENDASFRVRWQARTALLQYRVAGYRSSKKEEAHPGVRTEEPPLAGPESEQFPTPPTAPPAATQAGGSASTKPAVRWSSRPQPPLVPVSPPRLDTPPPAPTEGPELTPQPPR
jgi:hypothetical protein